MTKSAHRILLMTSLTLLVGGPWGCSEQASEPVVTLPDPVDSNTGDLDGVAVAPLDGIDGPETTECDPAAMRVIDIRPWTGGGVQVAVELLEAGEPVSDPESTSVARVLDDGARPRVDAEAVHPREARRRGGEVLATEEDARVDGHAQGALEGRPLPGDVDGERIQ